MNGAKIRKICALCSELFQPKTIDSIYCSSKCSKTAYRKKKALEKKDKERKAIVDKISGNRLYISVPEAIAIFGIAKSTLYRLIRQKKIPAINLGTRLIRIKLAVMEEMFPTKQSSEVLIEKSKPKLFSLEPEDCYTIGEITDKFGISNSSVYKHIRKFSIPTRQIGKYVYAPKSEIDPLYKK